jgi:hypothetical protein
MKKLIASLMTALMAVVTFASPALATAVNTYPTFLGSSGDFYVVVGEDAATMDVAGAIDIASNLAQLSFTETATDGTTSDVTGTERKIAIPSSATGGQIGGSGANNLPASLRNYHYSGLNEGQYSFKGTLHNFHEEARLLTAASQTPQMTHSLVDYVNGTLKMKVDTQGVEYRYVFDDAIAAGDWGYSTPNATSYESPLEVVIAGKSLQIVAIPSASSFKALSGNVGWIAEGEAGLSIDGLSVQVVTVYSATQASIQIVDENDNVINNIGVITTSTTPPSFTYDGNTYKVKLLSAAAASIAGQVGQAQLVFGKDEIETTFDGGDLAVVSGWGSEWKVSGSFASAPQISASDYISVKYQPTGLAELDKYYVAGDVFYGPGDYFELSYAGTFPSNFAQVTIQRVTGQTVYNTTAQTGYSIVHTGGGSNLNGLKISTDVGGSIVFNNVGYDEVYVLYNATPMTANTWNGSYFWLAYKDKATGRIVNFDTGAWPMKINNTVASTSFNYSLSYGGPGATSTFDLYGNMTAQKVLAGVNVSSSGTVNVDASFINRTATSSDLKLGATAGTAAAGDVFGLVEAAVADISTQLTDVITDGGIWVYSVKGNAAGDKLVLGIPPETVYALVQFGKIGPAAVDGDTIKQVVPVTTAVAKLDSEITETDKSNYHFVIVGGTCANDLFQAAVDATPSLENYTCAGGVAGSAWTEGTGFIMVLDDVFATGKYVVGVAGYDADDTRTASTMLQQYATKLDDIDTSMATITTATETVTAAA